MDAGTSRSSTGPPVIPARGGASHSLARGGGAELKTVAPSGEENLLSLPKQEQLFFLPSLYFILDSSTNYTAMIPERVDLTPCLQLSAKISGSGRGGVFAGLKGSKHIVRERWSPDLAGGVATNLGEV